MTLELNAKIIDQHFPWMKPYTEKGNEEEIDDITDAALERLVTSEAIPLDLSEREIVLLIELEESKLNQHLSNITTLLSTLPPITSTLTTLSSKQLEDVNIITLQSCTEIQGTIQVVDIVNNLPKDMQLWDIDSKCFSIDEIKSLDDLDRIQGMEFPMQNLTSKTLETLAQLSNLNDILIRSQNECPDYVNKIHNAIPQLQYITVCS